MVVPVGAISSIISIATFPLDLAETIQRISAFCSRVSNAPEELQDVVDQLSIMSDLMSQMSVMSADGLESEKKCLKQCLDLCGRALERMRNVADELQDQLAKNRRRTTVKIALKQDSFDRMLRKLDHSKGLLQLAYQAYTSAQSRDLISAQQHSIEELLVGQTVILQRTQRAQLCGYSHEVNKTLVLREQRSVKHKRSAEYREKEIFRIETPAWLLSRVWYFAINRSLTGWSFPLRSYRVVSGNNWYQDPAFCACCVNDVDKLQSLLEDRQATLHDQDAKGVSMFEVSPIMHP